jgi:hypothetical protein
MQPILLASTEPKTVFRHNLGSLCLHTARACLHQASCSEAPARHQSSLSTRTPRTVAPHFHSLPDLAATHIDRRRRNTLPRTNHLSQAGHPGLRPSPQDTMPHQRISITPTVPPSLANFIISQKTRLPQRPPEMSTGLHWPESSGSCTCQTAILSSTRLWKWGTQTFCRNNSFIIRVQWVRALRQPQDVVLHTRAWVMKRATQPSSLYHTIPYTRSPR